MMTPKTQSRYGFVSSDHVLSWKSKSSVLGMIGGINELVAAKLKKDGKITEIGNKH